MGKKDPFFDDLIDNGEEGREGGFLLEFKDTDGNGKTVTKLRCKGCGQVMQGTTRGTHHVAGQSDLFPASKQVSPCSGSKWANLGGTTFIDWRLKCQNHRASGARQAKEQEVQRGEADLKVRSHHTKQHQVQYSCC